jgi:hypothetical protein
MYFNIFSRHLECIRHIFYLAAISTIIWGWNSTFILDDAYITLHNARSLLEGHDPSYGVSALVGATSAVHLLLVAAIGLIFPMEWASALLALASVILYALMLDLALRRQGAEGWRLAILVVIGVTIGTVPLHLSNGLETGLAMATVAAMIAYWEDETILPILSGIAPFIRPELGALSAVLLCNLAWSKSRTNIILIFSKSFLTALPFIIWIYASTGGVLPSTASAKIAFMADNHHSLKSIAPFLISSAMILGGLWPLLFCLRGAKSRLAFCLFVFTIIFSIAALSSAPTSITWNHHRYLAIFVPMALALVPNIKPAKISAIYIILICISTAIQAPAFYSSLEREREIYQTTLVSISKLANTIPGGTKVLIHDAGIIAWYGQHLQLTDLVGLKSPQNIAAHIQYTRKGCEWSAALDQIIRESKVDHAVILQDPFWGCIKKNIESTGRTLHPLESFGNRYTLYRITED